MPETKAPPQLPQYGLENLYLFPFFQSREDYRAKVGQDAPTFDPNQPVKRWADPAAAGPGVMASYPRSLYRDEKNLPAEESGKPAIGPIVITKAFAKQVNIPPTTHTETADTFATKPEMGCPLRSLLPDEEIVFGTFSTVAVRNVKLWAAQVEQQSGTFLASDRALLQAIAKQLGVPA